MGGSSCIVGARSAPHDFGQSFVRGRLWWCRRALYKACAPPSAPAAVASVATAAARVRAGLLTIRCPRGACWHGDGIVTVERRFDVGGKGLCRCGAGYASVSLEEGCLRGGRYVAVRLSAKQQSGRQRKWCLRQRAERGRCCVVGRCASRRRLLCVQLRDRADQTCQCMRAGWRGVAQAVDERCPSIAEPR